MASVERLSLASAGRESRAHRKGVVSRSEIKVLSAGAVKRGVALRAADFEKAHGCRVELEFAIGPKVRERVLAGEAIDVVVAPPAVMDEFAQRALVRADTRGFIGRSRMGVFVRRGGTLPDISSAEAFTRAVLSADAVVYNKASSGTYMAKLLDRLGITPQVVDKTILVESGSAVMQTVAADARNTLGVGQISEIRVQIDKGTAIDFVGPLPDAIQNLTAYDAAAATTSRSPEVAQAFVAFLTADDGRRVFAATGID
jgi:molybdate transport system substrate-binding protein